MERDGSEFNELRQQPKAGEPENGGANNGFPPTPPAIYPRVSSPHSVIQHEEQPFSELRQPPPLPPGRLPPILDASLPPAALRRLSDDPYAPPSVRYYVHSSPQEGKFQAVKSFSKPHAGPGGAHPLGVAPHPSASSAQREGCCPKGSFRRRLCCRLGIALLVLLMLAVLVLMFTAHAHSSHPFLQMDKNNATTQMPMKR